MTGVRFIDFHRPVLTDGDYLVTSTVTVKGHTLKGQVQPSPYEAAQKLRVGGPIHPLQPSDIVSVFPPEGSLGDHSTVLPHAMLTRPTLPWERLGDGKDAPWLGLLLVCDDDLGAPLAFKSEILVRNGPRVETVELPNSLLQAIAPHRSDLGLLTHVREAADTGRESAVVVCQRLPSAGSRNSCLLVALEGRYTGGDEMTLDQGSTTRLVVLERWSFSCVAPQKSFVGLMAHIKEGAGTLRVPPTTLPIAQEVVASGTVALPAHLRGGSRTAGWYRGPCIAVEAAADRPPAADPWHASTADALIRFDAGNGIFDLSYAAAWEIGRLLGLASKSFARAISVYRRRLARSEYAAVLNSSASYIALLQPATPPTHELPAELPAMRIRLSRLEGLPFVYLVPDERALPSESFRFFRIDGHWIEAMIAGAFSLGRAHPADMRREHALRPAAVDQPAVCGFFLRSEVVAGWPGLEIEGVPKGGGEPIAPLRREKLSPTILLVLFDREIERIDMHLHQESLHLGLTPKTGGAFERELRNQDGGDASATLNVPATGQLWRDNKRRVLSAAGLVSEMSDNLKNWDEGKSPKDGGAFFAFQLIEGVDRISFAITPPLDPPHELSVQ
jgi:hypothetical protein